MGRQDGDVARPQLSERALTDLCIGTGAAAALKRLRDARVRDGDPSLETRREALRALRRMVVSEADSFAKAVSDDFGHRSWHETMISEISVVVAAIDHALARLHRWSRPDRIAVGWRFWPARARILKTPIGIVGILSPWNYPIQLSLSPMVGALSAGCRVVLKPSEHAPATASALAEAISGHIDPCIVETVLGDAETARAMAALPFDKLLFTGSTATGRKVLRAAAENLVPVVLELGGKSPAILDATADVARAAADILAGKFLNAGQTCVAPDYVLVPRAMLPDFVAAALTQARRLRPDPAGRDVTSVCRQTDRDRLAALVVGLNTITLGDDGSPGAAPCLVIDPPLDSAVMQAEIFGPVLPVVPYDDDDLFAVLDLHPSPLALYWFGRDRRRLNAILARTRSGGVAVNDTILQVAVEALPFGGIGTSGMGAYHGKAGFDAFTHGRAMFLQSRLSATRMLRPPYGRLAERIISGMIGSDRMG